MNENFVLSLIEENNWYQKEIKELKEKMQDKININILNTIIILIFSIIFIVGGVASFQDYFSISSILLQEILDIIPFSLGIYLLSRITTTLIYGFDKTNVNRITTLKNRIKENNKKIKKYTIKNSLNLEKSDELEALSFPKEKTFEYDTSYLETPKIKKIGTIKR